MAKTENAPFVEVRFLQTEPGHKKGETRVYHRSTAEILEKKKVAEIVKPLPKYESPTIKG